MRTPTGARGGATWPRAEEFAPLTGMLPVVLALAGLIVWEGPADRPEWDAPRRLMLDFYLDRDTVVLGGFLLMLAAVCFLCFAGWLRAVLRRAEAGDGALSAIAYGGGVAAAAFMLAMPAANVFAALFAQKLGPRSAQTFFFFGDVFLYPAAMAASVLVAATALVAFRTGVLPRWLGWLSLVLALWLLVPPLGAAAGTPENPAVWTALAALPAVLVWSALTSTVLLFGSAARHDT